MTIHSLRRKPFDLSVFYDGLCPVCSKEIDVYRRKDLENKIRFVDIADPKFDASKEGLAFDQIFEKFHVKTAKGEVIVGVDAFVEIWKTLEIFKPLGYAANSKLFRPFFDFGYVLFTKVRPWLRRSECETDYCETRS